MAQHNLMLKIGVPVILLRNLDVGRGLCNGTRLILKAVHRNLLEAEGIVGELKGQRVLIPRMPMTSSDTDLPFVLERLQFPVRVAFAMSINKAQGQTIRGSLGLYLPRPVFSHGQLYVAASRVNNPAAFKVQIEGRAPAEPAYTRNVVYKEIFRG